MGDLQKRSDTRAARKSSDTTFDRIYKFYFDKVEQKLSPKEDEIRQRWHDAWRLMCEFKTRTETVKLLSEEHQISEQVAYSDIKWAKMLFGDPETGDKAAKRAIVNEWIIKGLDKAYAAGDWQGYDKLILRYTRINGLDARDDDPILDMIKNRQPTAIIITSDPKSLEQEADELMKDVPAVDTQYTVVDDED